MFWMAVTAARVIGEVILVVLAKGGDMENILNPLI
jgi:hypothetical protein